MAKDKGFFKKAKMEKNKRLVTPYSEECAIQIPSEIDNEQMQRMPAGGEEDQYLRIKHMSALIKNMGTYLLLQLRKPGYHTTG